MTTPSADWVEPPEWFDPAAALEAKNPIPLLKQAIAEERRWIEQRLHAGASIESLIREHLRFTDALIQTCWQRFTWDENLNSWRKTRISLVAVGGYGRGELMPHSDIDLLLLSERDNLQKHAANIQSFTTLLWDIGLEIGHSVRSVKEAFRQAKGDVTIMTSMLDARLLSGSPILLDQLNRLLDRRKSWRITDFFDAKVQEQNERHAKSNHTEYSLEPNIKTSPGGLRDIQTLLWIAKLMYQTDDLKSLVARGFFEQQEADQLVEAQRFFWRVRFALHLARGKDENRLLFDHQRLLASLLGYEDKAQLAVEQFMQDYYRCALAVSSINEVSLQAFDERVLSTHRKKRTTARDLNERFQIIDEKLAAKAGNLFEQHPEALLEMFVILGESPTLKGIRSDTIRLAKTHVHLINDSFRQSETATGLFIRLLGVEHHLFSQLRRMNRLGILGAYLPEFERVVGQMQFDLFHIYTVDAHTLQVVRNMRRFRYK
ncbi:MAG: nucleotidyltransferase domain-containing protein, partial [Gammaproteobacteria bacterium]